MPVNICSLTNFPSNRLFRTCLGDFHQLFPTPGVPLSPSSPHLRASPSAPRIAALSLCSSVRSRLLSRSLNSNFLLRSPIYMSAYLAAAKPRGSFDTNMLIYHLFVRMLCFLRAIFALSSTHAHTNLFQNRVVKVQVIELIVQCLNVQWPFSLAWSPNRRMCGFQVMQFETM